MAVSNEFDTLIQKRRVMQGDIDYDNNPVIKDMISLMTRDVSQTVDFIENDCTEEQFIWLSEILDEIVEKTKSPEIIAALRHAAKKYPKATAEYNINYFIDSAAEYLE